MDNTDNLSRRGWHGEGVCVLCSEGSETVDHLFSECSFSKDILCSLLPNKAMISRCSSSGMLWEVAGNKGRQVGSGSSRPLLPRGGPFGLKGIEKFSNQKNNRQSTSSLKPSGRGTTGVPIILPDLFFFFFFSRGSRPSCLSFFAKFNS